VAGKMAGDFGSTTPTIVAPGQSTPTPASERSSTAFWSYVRLLRLLIAVVSGALIWALPRPEPIEPRGWHLLAIFVGTIVAIIARPLPMGAVAMIGMAVTLVTGTLELKEALIGFGNDVVWLVVAAFLLAGTFIRTGLGRRIAFHFMSNFGRKTLGLSYSLAATDLVLAPIIPSHSARSGGVVFPILKSIAQSAFGSSGTEDARSTAGFLTMAAYQSTVVNGAMFLTAMGGNPLAAELAGQQGVRITWALWALAGVVPGLVSLAVIPLILYSLHPPAIRTSPDACAIAQAELRTLGPMRRDERVLLAVFAGLLVTWSLGEVLGIESAEAALGAVGVLLLTGVLRWDDVAGDHEAWNTFVWFAVLVMMATELGRFGIPGWFGGVVTSAVGGDAWLPGFLVMSLAYFYSHYFFASNTAHISSMYAPFLAVAIALGTPPLLAALVLAFFSNLFGGLTHYTAAAAPIFFGTGYVPLGTWWKLGGVLSVVNITIWLVVGGAWWKLLGLW
jgi:DASS family divalent anion:Na+ symporter